MSSTFLILKLPPHFWTSRIAPKLILLSRIGLNLVLLSRIGLNLVLLSWMDLNLVLLFRITPGSFTLKLKDYTKDHKLKDKYKILHLSKIFFPCPYQSAEFRMGLKMLT